MGTMHRTQILLEPEQHQLLTDIAQRESRSVSDLLREVVDRYLAEREGQDQQQRHALAIGRLTQIRKRLERQHGILHRDLLTEAREEREADFEHRWMKWDQ